VQKRYLVSPESTENSAGLALNFMENSNVAGSELCIRVVHICSNFNIAAGAGRLYCIGALDVASLRLCVRVVHIWEYAHRRLQALGARRSLLG